MPVSQPASFNLQEFADNGITLVGGRLYTLFAGTTTFRAAFTDPAGLIPHTYAADGSGGQYIALNARGELPASLYLASGSYDLALKRADGSTVWTRRADGVADASNEISASLLADDGSTRVGFLQAGAGSKRRLMQSKARDTLDAADFITTPGASVPTDKAGVLAACNAAAALGGGVVRVRKPISAFDLASLGSSIPVSVIVDDQRYADSGWQFLHNEGDDAQMGLRGRASALGEGPSMVMHNLASTGNRNVSYVHWYGPSNAPVVASFEHWGYNSDGAWYAGREWLSKGSIDTGARARIRQGNDGGIVFNPNGDVSSFKNNPAQGFTQGYIYVFNTPAQSGYSGSGKYILGLKESAVESAVEVRLLNDKGVRFQNAAGVDQFGILPNYPSAGVFTIWDYVSNTAMMQLTRGAAEFVNLTGITLTAATAASVPNGSMFTDSADNKLKFKDSVGNINALY